MFKRTCSLLLASGIFCAALSASAKEVATTQLKLYKLEQGKETLISAPHLVTAMNTEGEFTISGEGTPEIHFTMRVNKNQQRRYHLMSRFSVFNQEGTYEIDNLEQLKTQTHIYLDTEQGRFKVSLAVQSDEQRDPS